MWCVFQIIQSMGSFEGTSAHTQGSVLMHVMSVSNHSVNNVIWRNSTYAVESVLFHVICHKSFRVMFCLMVHQRIRSGECPLYMWCEPNHSVALVFCIIITAYALGSICIHVICVKNHSVMWVRLRHISAYTVENVLRYVKCVINRSVNRLVLQVHQHIHSRKHPYPCDVLHKSFSQQSNLKKHCHIHRVNHP